MVSRRDGRIFSDLERGPIGPGQCHSRGLHPLVAGPLSCFETLVSS